MRKILGLIIVIGFGAAAQSVFAASLGTLSENIGVGNTLSVELNSSAFGTWYVSESNSAVTQSTVSNNKLTVKGLTAGNSTVSVCTQPQGGDCLIVAVLVQNVLGSSISSTSPVGTWVISDRTVFYVHTAGLIPVSTPEIFYNNGGNFNSVMPISGADMYLPLLPLMVMNDSRLN